MRRRYVILRVIRPTPSVVDKIKEVSLKLFGLCSLAPYLRKVDTRGLGEEFIVLRTTNEAVRQVVAACTLTPLSDDGVLRVVGVTGTLAKAKEIVRQLS